MPRWTKNQEHFHNAIIPPASEYEESDSEAEAFRSSMRQLTLNSNLDGLREKKSGVTTNEEKSKVLREVQAMAQMLKKTRSDSKSVDADDDETDETILTNSQEQSVSENEESDFETEAFKSSMLQLMSKIDSDRIGEKKSRTTADEEKSKLLREVRAMAQMLGETEVDTKSLDSEDDETDEMIYTTEDADSSKDLRRVAIGNSVRGSDETRINLDAGEPDRNIETDGSKDSQKETSSRKLVPFFDPAEVETPSLECGQCGSPCDEDDMRDFGKCIFCRQKDLRDPQVHKITNIESPYVFNSFIPPVRAKVAYISETDQRLMAQKQRKEQQERLSPNRIDQPLNDEKVLPPVKLQFKQVQIEPPVIPNAMKTVDKIDPPVAVSGRAPAVAIGKSWSNEETEKRQTKLQPREVQDNYPQREQEDSYRQYENASDGDSDFEDEDASVERLGNLERKFGEFRYALDTDVFKYLDDNRSLVALMSVSEVMKSVLVY